MKFINIVEVFCEILSGIVLFIVFIPILDISSISSLQNTISYISANLNSFNIALIIVLSYLLGLIMDAIGLSIGEWFLDKLILNESISDDENKKFYCNVSPHVLSYRDTQWAYASVYRNLFILLIPNGIFWFICIGRNYNWIKAIIFLVIVVLLEIIFYKSVKVLYKIYITITKSIE